MLELTVTLDNDRLAVRRADGIAVDSACGAEGDALSASELLAASLGACVAASIAPLCRRHGLDPAAVHVRIAPRGDALAHGLTVTVTLPACEAAVRARCRRAAETCPVGQALNVPLEFHWSAP